MIRTMPLGGCCYIRQKLIQFLRRFKWKVWIITVRARAILLMSVRWIVKITQAEYRLNGPKTDTSCIIPIIRE